MTPRSSQKKPDYVPVADELSEAIRDEPGTLSPGNGDRVEVPLT